jgi:hypothetical protein
VHDITDLESRGIPGGFIASTEFIDAAEAQSSALGFEPNSVFVQHPIQDRTQEEVEQLAEEAFDDILALVQIKN